MGNSRGFKIQFSVYPINPRGTWWRGFSCPKSEKWPIQVSKVACSPLHSITLKHEINYMIYTQDVDLIGNFWSMMNYGVPGSKVDDLRNDDFVI